MLIPAIQGAIVSRPTKQRPTPFTDPYFATIDRSGGRQGFVSSSIQGTSRLCRVRTASDSYDSRTMPLFVLYTSFMQDY
jgi:hypothetical protein